MGPAALTLPFAVLLGVLASSQPGARAEPRREGLRTERFDQDPRWDSHNNRSPVPASREVRQEFGWSKTSPSVGGRIGGFVCPDPEPAFYAKRIPKRTLKAPFSASGTLVVLPGGTLEDGAGNTLIGFFNAGTLNEWRTPNTVALRINGRGAGFHAHLEYATSRWRAGAEFFGRVDPKTGRKVARLFPSGEVVHTWSLAYQPEGNGGKGTLTATLDGEKTTCNLDDGHKLDGASFNRFGLLTVMKSADEGGTLWVGDLTVDGAEEPTHTDPGWQGFRNRRTRVSKHVRPRFDFGYSATRYAHGRAVGECGGLIYRGDQRFPDRLAYYGDRLDPLNLERPLFATGKVAMHRGVTDSTILFGFFHGPDSARVGPEQSSGIPENFVGVAVEGPSREGFLMYPVYGVDREGEGVAPRFDPLPPRIHPDGRSHTWRLEYRPDQGAAGRVTVAVDGQTTELDLQTAHRKIGARFNRFGFVTTHIDGNDQRIYLDDLTYTWRQEN